MSSEHDAGPPVLYGAMLDPVEAERRLRARGARMTPQRRVVLAILAGNRTHPTAESLIDEVRQRLQGVSAATIYNTLDTLEALGLVRRITGLEDKAHFDPDTADHQHAICVQCHRVFDVGAVAPPPDLPPGFRLQDILIQGICGSCARSTQHRKGEDERK